MTPNPLEKVIEALHLADLPEEEQESMLLELNALVFRGSIMRMIEGMDEPTKAAFSTLVEKGGSEEELQAFLAENVPHADQAVADTIAALTSDILAVTNNQ